MAKKRKGTWGGRRAGSGKKSTRGPLLTYSVDLREDQVLLLKRWGGGGDISETLRWLIDAARPLIRRNEPRPPTN